MHKCHFLGCFWGLAGKKILLRKRERQTTTKPKLTLKFSHIPSSWIGENPRTAFTILMVVFWYIHIIYGFFLQSSFHTHAIRADWSPAFSHAQAQTGPSFPAQETTAQHPHCPQGQHRACRRHLRWSRSQKVLLQNKSITIGQSNITESELEEIHKHHPVQLLALHRRTPRTTGHAEIPDQQTTPAPIDSEKKPENPKSGSGPALPCPAEAEAAGGARQLSLPCYLPLQNTLKDTFWNANQIFFSETSLDTSLSYIITESCQNSLVGKLFPRHVQV